MKDTELYPIGIAEMRSRYLTLFSGVVNDVLRFNYKMHASSLPPEFAPLREDMKIAGQAFHHQRRTRYYYRRGI